MEGVVVRRMCDEGDARANSHGGVFGTGFAARTRVCDLPFSRLPRTVGRGGPTTVRWSEADFDGKGPEGPLSDQAPMSARGAEPKH